MDMDPFDSLFSLEEIFYKEGYELGLADGRRAGLIEGRLTGLERGFEKFAQMGRLHGKCVIWAGRLPNSRNRRKESGTSSHPKSDVCEEGENMVAAEKQEEETEITNNDSATEKDQKQKSTLPPSSYPKPNHHIPPSSPTTPPRFLSTITTNNNNNGNNNSNNPRLNKHILTLYALVEPASLSIRNTEEAVSDFDDRLRRAEGKVKIIERITGEGEWEGGRVDEMLYQKKKDEKEEGIEELGKGVLESGKVRY